MLEEPKVANAILIIVVYGPIISTLVCWLFLAIENSRTREPRVVRVLIRAHNDREEGSE